MRKIKQYLITIAALLSLSAPALLPATTYADCPAGDSAKGQVLNGVGETGGCSDAGFSSAIKTIVNLISYIAGIIAVIMVVVAGIKYTTSGGDSGKVAAAKNTLIYALIGVAVAALAQFLVHFVLTQANNADNPEPKKKTSQTLRAADVAVLASSRSV